MKLKVTQSELNECFNNAIKRIVSEGKDKRHTFGKEAFEKATKRANRDVEREYKGDGFKSYNKVHKSPKDYSRKGKDKFVYSGELDEDRLDISSPFDDGYYDDGYDTSEIPNVSDYTRGVEFGSDLENKNEAKVIVRTDIDKVEETLIADILDTFDQAEDDIIDGYVSFIIPQSIVKPFKKYLKANQVEIISNK